MLNEELVINNSKTSSNHVVTEVLPTSPMLDPGFIERLHLDTPMCYQVLRYTAGEGRFFLWFWKLGKDAGKNANDFFALHKASAMNSYHTVTN